MPRAYSDDLRVRILESYERHEGEWEELAKRFGVSLGYAKKIRKQQLRYGQKERKAQCRHGPVSRVTEAVEKELRDQVGEQPDATLQELGQRLWQRTHISLSRTRLWEVLLRLELRRKKTLHAAEQDSAAAQQKRQNWWQEVRAIDPARLVFVDESGANTSMTRRYGRSAPGQRVREGAPAGHWRTLTMLGAMSQDGVLASMTIPEPTDGDIFLAFVEQVLSPRLQPGQVVVMDNLSAHKVTGVREQIAARGARLLYLPPYSPDFNPIEKCWAKIKENLRALKARSLPLLDEAMAQALATISAQNAQAWFRHSAMGIQQL